MKKLIRLFGVLIPMFALSQTTFQLGYQTAFADALCFREASTCQRRIPLLKAIPTPTYDESSNNFLDGYARGVTAGFDYKNSINGTRYSYSEYAQYLYDMRSKGREKAVQQTEDFYNEDLRRRYPVPSDSRQKAVYDAIMSHDL